MKVVGSHGIYIYLPVNWHCHGQFLLFLVNTINMVDFPARYVHIHIYTLYCQCWVILCDVTEQWKNPGWLDYIGDYIGIIINHYQNPYKPTSIMESKRVFFVAQLFTNWIFLYHSNPRGTERSQVVRLQFFHQYLRDGPPRPGYVVG